MPNDFEIITQFLSQQDGDEVTGRDLAPPPDDLQERLQAFARGGVDESERQAMCEEMKAHPHYVAYLAEVVKKLREAS
ncbi:MAG: hypothetical protein AAGK14_06790 [Verrucomicrobiota bacterium]